MPLKCKKTVYQNVQELEVHGTRKRSRKQNFRIAYEKKRECERENETKRERKRRLRK